MNPSRNLENIVSTFVAGLVEADSRRPVAPVSRTGNQYRPGIGPHSEVDTIRLTISSESWSAAMGNSTRTSVPYPRFPAKRCDIVVGDPAEWAIECKMARFLGDNGKNANQSVADFLSPYESDRSALTDCVKLAQSGFQCMCSVLIFAYESDVWSVEPLLDAFETLAEKQVLLGSRTTAQFSNLVHPIHKYGRVCAWQTESP